jgi:hypothetical protein
LELCHMSLSRPGLARLARERSDLAPLFVLLLAACSGGELGPDPDEIPTSFSRIQTEIFDVSCVGCHTAGSQDAIRSGLILDRGVAYQNLVGASPTHAAARSDGLSRVRPFRPDSSLLLRKLDWEPVHHGAGYGSPMPIGGPPPSVGQLEFVRRWIAQGRRVMATASRWLCSATGRRNSSPPSIRCRLRRVAISSGSSASACRRGSSASCSSIGGWGTRATCS